LQLDCASLRDENSGHWLAIAEAFKVKRGHFKNMLEVVESIERLQSDKVTLLSALENWGQHHGWCACLQNNKVVNELACNCGLREARQK